MSEKTETGSSVMPKSVEGGCRIAVVGCGHRAVIGFIGTLKSIGRSEAVRVLCDVNPVRLQVAAEYLANKDCRTCTRLEEVLSDPEINTVIVTTPDHTHADIVEACYRAGKTVVCEKPMATTIEDCQRILDAAAGQELRVAFNLRYNPVLQRAKELLCEGVIGRVLHAQVNDIIRWQHGADYFRRWHRFSEKSVGLLLHKSTHCFDVVNWLLDDQPVSVFARSARQFYTPEQQRGERCMGCAAMKTCPHYVDLSQDMDAQGDTFPEFYKKMYLNAESHDGYIRDACVFDSKTDIADTYDVSVRYQNGALLNYSALFYAPYPNRRFVLEGTKGRMEVLQKDRDIRVMFAPEQKEDLHVHVPEGAGTHGGADTNLMKALFEETQNDRSFAPVEAGYWSVAIGACANISIEEGRDVPVPPLKSDA